MIILFNIVLIFFRFIYLEDCGHTIESEALTKWIYLKKDKEISLKQCPLCKTPILKTQRFMNHVKIILQDLSKIKIKQYGEVSVIRSKMNTIMNTLKSLDNDFILNFVDYGYDNAKDLWDKFCKPILLQYNSFYLKPSKFSLPAKDIESLHFVIELCKSISTFKDRIKKMNDQQRKQTITSHFVWLLSVAFTFARQLSNQQKLNMSMEFARGARILSLFEIMSNTTFQNAVTMQTCDTIKIKKIVDDMEAMLMSRSIYTLSRDQDIQNLTEEIEQKIDGVSLITDEDRQMIHMAMSTSFLGGIKTQGRWCKCLNGHIYCVIECGGLMQQSVCPECEVQTSGQGHRHV